MGKMFEKVIFKKPPCFNKLVGGLGLAVTMYHNGMTFSKQTNKRCTVVMIDVQNVLNLINVSWINSTLVELGVCGYLLRLTESYLSRRLLWYEMSYGPKKLYCDSRCSSRFHIGAPAMEYHGVHDLRVPEQATLVGCTDYLPVAKHLEGGEIWK